MMNHSKYTRGRIAAILQEIDHRRTRGETLQQAAANAGISCGTYYRWMRKHPEIARTNRLLLNRRKGEHGVSYHVEQAIIKLREIDHLHSQGKSIELAVEKSGITMEMYYRWRDKYGWMTLEDADKLQKLEEENEKLKSLVVMWQSAFGAQTSLTVRAENPHVMT